jgi:hypothetical protein
VIIVLFKKSLKRPKEVWLGLWCLTLPKWANEFDIRPGVRIIKRFSAQYRAIHCVHFHFFVIALEYIGIDNYKAIYKYVQLQRNGNVHSE